MKKKENRKKRAVFLAVAVLMAVYLEGNTVATEKEIQAAGNFDIESSGKDKFIPDDAFAYNRHFYKCYDTASTWNEARDFCKKLGGHLATITSQEENDAVYTYMLKAGYESAYFGFTDNEKESNWVWVTGEQTAYTNWDSGEPNNEGGDEDYAMFYYKNPDGTWNDGDFGGSTVNGGIVFICEWEDETVSSGDGENPGETNLPNSLIPNDAFVYGGHFYYCYPVASGWEDAVHYCESLGGYLATITSQKENDAVYDYMVRNGYESAYFGFTDNKEEGCWIWVTGEPAGYTNWENGEPNNVGGDEDYAMFYYKNPNGTWNDGDFGGSTVNGGTAFICEWGDYMSGSLESPAETKDPSKPKDSQKITYYSSAIKKGKVTYGSSFSLNAKTTGLGKLTYKSSNNKILSINANGKATVKGYGPVSVKIKASGGNGYKAAVRKVRLIAVPRRGKVTKAVQKNGTVRIQWKPEKTADGYEYAFAYNKKFSGQNRKKTSKTGLFLTKYKTGTKKMYFKVRTYKKVGKKTCYGSWSKVRILKLKKAPKNRESSYTIAD